MGRLTKSDEKVLGETLAAPPQPERDWKPIVEKRFRDPARRDAVLAELASLDEMERSYRPHMLRGIASAATAMIAIKKTRTKLLGFDLPDLEPGETETVDVVDFAPLVPDEAQQADDAQLSADLEAVLQAEADG